MIKINIKEFARDLYDTEKLLKEFAREKLCLI